METYMKHIIIGCFLFLINKKINEIIGVPPIPQLDQNEWWGNSNPDVEEHDIKPFRINTKDVVM